MFKRSCEDPTTLYVCVFGKDLSSEKTVIWDGISLNSWKRKHERLYEHDVKGE